MASRPYRCNKCHASGVKLWRDYGTPFHWDLWCVDCACAADPQGRFDPATVREDGTRPYPQGGSQAGAVTDTLGWYVPAIPSDGPKDAPDAYWGYTSTDSEDYKWWQQQPLRASVTA